MNVALDLFGPEYADAKVETIGTFVCHSSDKHVDISYTNGGMNLSILPVGGYAIRYVSGSFLLMGQTPTVFAVGGNNGMKVQWRNDISADWAEANFTLYDETIEQPEVASDATNINNLFYLEFTRPHRMRLVPPRGSAGDVKVRVIRYVPKFTMDMQTNQTIVNQ